MKEYMSKQLKINLKNKIINILPKLYSFLKRW